MRYPCLLAVSCAAIAVCHAGSVLLEDDFEHGKRAAWRVATGQWHVVPEPGRADNHVLRLTVKDGSSGVMHAGSAQWRNYRVSCRMRIDGPTGAVYHLKLGCRATAQGSRFVNLRESGPAVVHNEGREFRQLGRVGGWPVKPGKWYEASIECSGPILTARARQAGDKELAEARFYDEGPAAGGIHLTVWMPKGDATVLFDDVRVVEVAAPETLEAGRKAVIEDDTLRLSLDEALGTFDLLDKRTGTAWTQPPARGLLPTIESVEKAEEGRALVATMGTAAGRVAATFRLEGRGELTLTLAPKDEGRYVQLSYPSALEPPTAKAELVLPTDQGICVPVTSDLPNLASVYRYQQYGIVMPWFGLLVGEAGLMTLVETSDDFQLAVIRARLGEERACLPRVVWLPSRQGLRYPRRLRFCLFHKGGYVAMAKRYRRWLIDQGRFRTLEEKAREIPNVRKLIGAVNVLDHSGDDTVLDWMIASGIRRALYSCGPRKARIANAIGAGYVVNRYDIYTDIAGPELLEHWGKPRSELDHRRIGYPDECFILRSGKPRPGFGYPVGAKGGVDPEGKKGKRIRCYNRCSACKLAWLKRVIPPQLEAGYTARFIDVETALPFLECYSPKHPLTRSDDRAARLALFDYLRSLGQVCSSEGGADWAAHALHYQEGSMNLLHHGGHIHGVYVGTAPFDLPDSYIKTQLDPTIRVPLHELVYHDSTFTTWRWNHTPNRWRPREPWDDWDLLHTLYAAMPIFVVHKRYLADQGARILQSHRLICGFAEKAAGSEMLAHRFLTPDRLVQETRYASGWAVVVNFRRDKPHTMPDGTAVAPHSAHPFRFRD